MPATQGAVAWPSDGPTATALVFDEELPLVNSSIDRMLLVHSLEHVENPRETLNEIWRVLSPAGRIVIVVPNRRGVWARFEHTPFGTAGHSRAASSPSCCARPTSRVAWSDALLFPPSRRNWMMHFDNLLESAGRRLWPIFSRVIVVEAQKRLYQGVPVAQRASRRVFVPVLSPQGANRLGRLPKPAHDPEKSASFFGIGSCAKPKCYSVLCRVRKDGRRAERRNLFRPPERRVRDLGCA